MQNIKAKKEDLERHSKNLSKLFRLKLEKHIHWSTNDLIIAVLGQTGLDETKELEHIEMVEQVVKILEDSATEEEVIEKMYTLLEPTTTIPGL